jgi:hypothetical protein
MSKPKIKAALNGLTVESDPEKFEIYEGLSAGKEKIKKSVCVIIDAVCELLQNGGKPGY